MSGTGSAPSAVKVDTGDTARAETTLPFPVALPEDVALWLRLNPFYTIDRWEETATGFHFSGHNASNNLPFDTSVRIERTSETLRLRYAAGLKQATCFAVEPAAEGSRLVVTETYPCIADPTDPRVAEVDKSLVPWVTALRRHLLARRRWGGLPGWQAWNERFMPGMPPRQRRIVRLLIWSTVFEFAIFFGLVIVLRFAT